jgi:hypothetical protein
VFLVKIDAERHCEGSYYYLTTTALPANNPPQTFNFTVNVFENSLVNLTLPGDDKDAEDTLFWFIMHPYPEYGFIDCRNATGDRCHSGEITYTPAPNYYGDDFLYFCVSDGKDNSTIAMVRIIVVFVNGILWVKATNGRLH